MIEFMNDGSVCNLKIVPSNPILNEVFCKSKQVKKVGKRGIRNGGVS